MNRIYVHGLGAVSPGGWGVGALYDTVNKGDPLPAQELPLSCGARSCKVRPVPPPPGRPEFLAHPRLRRVSTLTQHATAAALEALGSDATEVQNGRVRLGIVVCLLAGCVNYSRRFFEETLADPKTASPVLFPETVFNAPASHIAAYLNSTAMSYTLVGDESCFIQALPLAAGWILNGRVDACLVIGAEELDWISANAAQLFSRKLINAAGAGALYLRADHESLALAELAAVTESFSCASVQSRSEAARNVRRHLPAESAPELLCLSTHGLKRADAGEELAWDGWGGPRLAPKAILGEGFTAAAAWQCVLACETIRQSVVSAANVSVIGASQQAIGARFIRCAPAGGSPAARVTLADERVSCS